MNDDLLILLNRLKSVDTLDDLDDVKELGDSILRKEKRRALHIARHRGGNR
uniref:Uncharacterized protein n=1 Tax=Candidatus Kentrum sp. FM TaxID=2126340 RepID=A0A450T5H1_9GAMM|nr:MAG: hypothetical protein BECKFM1743C_GA0114222_102814 [Candidatus Kentron sp. FM]VFJ61921.1 MAG: hypothetical protein BECKFM1743A_GA0114220_102956 [Candidatus Kentron sp. FM]VFK12833.1 MAG: hypothetical protein BECKFM1743B_GA0114221_102576 [Candidatus Kentron sp. FM]